MMVMMCLNYPYRSADEPKMANAPTAALDDLARLRSRAVDTSTIVYPPRCRPLLVLFLFSFFFSLSAQDLARLPDARPVTLTGGFRVGMQYYAVSGIDERAAPLQYTANGRLNLSIYEQFNVPFSFAVGRMRPGFNFPVYRQFGLSPRYKWLTLHGGYRNMRLSNFTLNNHTFLGGGIELTPGKLRLAAMSGRLRQGTREVAENIDLFFAQPLYNRYARGGRIGFGSEANHLDLIYFRAEDREANVELPADRRLPSPAENVVVGAEWQLELGDHFNARAEVAASGYNRNRGSAELPLEDYPTARALEFLFTPRFSAQTGLAVQGGAGYRNGGFSLGVEYERIDPGFESMGTYFLTGDWENVRARLGFGLLGQKLRVQSSLGRQRNNLDGQRAETSRRLIGSVNATLTPGARTNLNLNYANFTQDHRPTALVVFNDTLRIATTTANYGLTWSTTGKGGEGRPVGTLTATANLQRTDNDNPLNEGFDEVETRFGSLNYSLRLGNATTTLSFGANYTGVTVFGRQTTGLGGTFGLRQQLAGRRLSLNVANTFNRNAVDGVADGFSNALRANLGWRVGKLHQVTLGVSWLERNSDQGFGFSEQRANLGYGFTLPTPKKKKPEGDRPPEE